MAASADDPVAQQSGQYLDVAACNHPGNQSGFLLGLADNGAQLMLRLSANVLAIIAPCSPTEACAHIT
jgi:hypothetical protein